MAMEKISPCASLGRNDKARLGGVAAWRRGGLAAWRLL